MLEELLIHHLKEKYGEFNPVRLMGGYTNQTFLLHGTNPLLVVKIAGSSNLDVQNELNSLFMLQEKGSVPKVFDVINLDSWQLIVMEYRSGTNGQAILKQNDLEKAKELYKWLGKSLAKDIHSTKYQNHSTGIRESNSHELNLNLVYIPDDLKHISKKVLSNLKDPKEEWVLTHGDYGPHNVLFAENKRLTVLDFEWSEWANPLTDLSWLCWFTSLHYSEYADTLLPLFIEEYLTINPIPLSSKKLKAFSVYKVWKVLGKIERAPMEVKQEWIRRLKWTIETDIFHLPNFR